jgi:hypothetical protein
MTKRPDGCALQSLMLGFAALVMLLGGRAQPQTLDAVPPQVLAAIVEKRKSCDPEAVALKPGFVTRKDINGDGATDYILDYGKFVCGGTDQSFFCGTAGCLTQVFVSLPDGTFTKVLDENVRDLRFARVKGRPAMLLGFHGGKCGRNDAEPCGLTLYWNGREFNPAD